MKIMDRALILNVWFCGIGGLYFGLVSFALITSLFFVDDLDAHQVLSGYAKSMSLGACVGVISAFCFNKFNDYNKR
ncbi:MAG: hypothetical protein COB38_11120 [Gammaproteobacteria bacterium]|nr:MAG: hypothetical protein COB38_11120 [Gammaproteobacteria bacterium]